MSRKQLHGDFVGHPHAEATLQLQAAEREVNDPHSLKTTMAVDERRNTGRIALVAPPDRQLGISRREQSIIHVNQA
jgi:hypothetical protein